MTTATGQEVVLARVGDLLREFPEFGFDIAGYLRSTKHAEWLRETWARIQTGGHRLTPADLVLRTADLRHRISGYHNLPRVRTLDDIPMLTGRRLRADPLLFVDPAETGEPLVTTTTSGTTGPSLQVFYTRRFHLRELFLAVPTVLVRAGLGDLLTVPFLTMHLTDSIRATAQVYADPPGLFGLQARASFTVGDPASVDRVFAMIESLQPAAVTSRPELLGVLVDAARRRGGNPFARVSCVVSSGSTLTPARRADLAGFFGRPVVELYGLSEVGLVATPCPASALHVEPSVVAETLADEAIVLSSLSNAAMPLLRYDTGDRGRLDHGCGCGSAAPRLVLAPRRVVPCFRWPSGELFLPTVLHDVFEQFPVREFRVAQVAPNRLEIVVEPAAAAAPATLVADVAKAVAAVLPISVTVAVTVGDLRVGRPSDRYRSHLAD